MQIKKDDALFDELQLRLKNWLGRLIYGALEGANLDADAIDALCDSILFDVTSLIDGAHEPLVCDGVEATPRLMFVKTDVEETLIAPQEGGSWMHEYSMGTSGHIRKGTAIY